MTWGCCNRRSSPITITVTGHVEVGKKAQAQVTVEGIIAVEEVSTTTQSEKTSSSRKRTDYHSNGKTYAAKVARMRLIRNSWPKRRVGPSGRVEGTNPTRLHNVPQTQLSANVAEHGTGSVLPLAFGVTLTMRSAKVNDKVISFTDAPANRWTNWGRAMRKIRLVSYLGFWYLDQASSGQSPCWFHEDHGVELK